MPRGEKLFRFLAKLMVDRFYGSVTIKFEAGKVTHVGTETRRAWQYRDLPDERNCECAEIARNAWPRCQARRATVRPLTRSCERPAIQRRGGYGPPGVRCVVMGSAVQLLRAERHYWGT